MLLSKPFHKYDHDDFTNYNNMAEIYRAHPNQLPEIPKDLAENSGMLLEYEEEKIETEEPNESEMKV